MGLLSLIFNRPKHMKINTVNEAGEERELLILDMTKNISHQNVLTPTDNPIEDGSVFSDHMDLQPKQLSFEGIMSDAPISFAQAIVGNVAGAIPAVAGLSGSIKGTLFSGAAATLGGLLLNSGDRVQEALNSMLELQEKKLLTTIITGLRTYNNMALISFTPLENSETGNSLAFTASFKEVRVVKSESVALPRRVLDAAAAASATSVNNQGKQVSGPASDEVSTKGASFLSTVSGVGA